MSAAPAKQTSFPFYSLRRMIVDYFPMCCQTLLLKYSEAVECSWLSTRRGVAIRRCFSESPERRNRLTLSSSKWEGFTFNSSKSLVYFSFFSLLLFFSLVYSIFFYFINLFSCLNFPPLIILILRTQKSKREFNEL